MAVGQATHELEVRRILVAQQPAQRFDLAGRPVRDVGQRALLDLAVLAISLPQQKSRWRCPIRNPINVHDSRESCRFGQVKLKMTFTWVQIARLQTVSISINDLCQKCPATSV